MAHSEMSLEETLKLLQALANRSLVLWDIPDGALARLINVSENATYLVEAPGYKSVLRIHRENYHSENAIACELTWADALNDEGRITTPGIYAGKDGKRIQSGTVSGLTVPRFMVLFHFVEGAEPDTSGDPEPLYQELGEIAARTHIHSIGWTRPKGFERLTWDCEAVFGTRPTWGNWRDGPEVTDDVCSILERVETTIKTRLTAFGKGPDRFGLIHADMRLANLLTDGNGTRLIDFDDCGFGWYLYDFATAISFIEDDPNVSVMKTAWVTGYRHARALSDEDAREIETFVMLRRMALLAWIGSHIEAPEPRALAVGFARVTAELGRVYLQSFEAV
ncbi:MAG: phosphotransferase [Rhodobacteraceae bacterium]|nr:phosphotransferase [Paracoccaceae bacterium]